jgi:hypothetical protein
MTDIYFWNVQGQKDGRKRFSRINIKEDKAHKKISSCTVIMKWKNLGKLLHKTKCKWENHNENFTKFR